MVAAPWAMVRFRWGLMRWFSGEHVLYGACFHAPHVDGDVRVALLEVCFVVVATRVAAVPALVQNGEVKGAF